MGDIIQQLEDLKEWSQNPERYERRLNFRGGQLVQPGPGRQGYAEGPKIGKTELKQLRLSGMTIPEIAKKFGVSVGTINTRLTDYDLVGTYKRVKPMSNRKIAEIKKTLPDGVRFQWVPWGKSGEQGSWKLMANIDKRNKTVFSKSYRNPDLSQIKQLVQDYENAYKKYYPNSLSNTEFEKLRFSNTVSKKFKTKYKNLTAKQFAEVLNGLGYKTAQDLDFNVGRVHDIQRKLDIFGEVGREVKPLTKGQQNTLINAFPEYADQWDFKANKYGLQYSEVGKPVWTMLRHTADDTKRWPTGNTAKSRLWHGAYRSALKGGDKGRFKILHPVDGEIMSRDEILKYNWTKGSSDIKFVDTLTDEVFDYKGFEKWMNNHAVPGKVDPNRFKNAEAQYDLTKKLKQIKIGDETFGSLLDKKFKGKGSGNLRFSGFHNHHLYDIADNFWDTDVVFFKDNLGIAKFEKGARQALRDAAKLPEAEQTKFLKSFANKFKDMGPIRLVEGEMTLGSYGREDMLKNVAKQTNLNKTQTKEFLKLAGKKSLPVSYGLSSNLGAVIDDALKADKFKGLRNILKGEFAFAALDFVNNLSKGQSVKKAFQKAIEVASFETVDLGADEKALIKHATEKGASQTEIDAMRNYLKYMKKYKIYERANKMLEYTKKNLSEGAGTDDYMDVSTTWEDVTDAAQNLKLREGELEDLYNIYTEGTSDMQLGSNMLTQTMNTLAAEEWNKTAGTMWDRGARPKQGEGIIWGGVGAIARDIGAIATGKMPTNFWDYVVPAQIDPFSKVEKQIRIMERPAVGVEYPEYQQALEDMKFDLGYALPEQNYADGGLASLLKKK